VKLSRSTMEIAAEESKEWGKEKRKQNARLPSRALLGVRRGGIWFNLKIMRLGKGKREEAKFVCKGGRVDLRRREGERGKSG